MNDSSEPYKEELENLLFLWKDRVSGVYREYNSADVMREAKTNLKAVYNWLYSKEAEEASEQEEYRTRIDLLKENMQVTESNYLKFREYDKEYQECLLALRHNFEVLVSLVRYS